MSSKWWQGFTAIAHKEVVQLGRNRRRIVLLILAQVMDFIVIGGIDLTVRELPTVIVDQDHSVESRELVQRMAATHTFDFKYTTTSTDQARDHIRAGRARVAIVIPPDYGRSRSSLTNAHFLAIVDGSDSAASNQATESIEGVATRMNIEAEREVVASSPTITTHAVLLFNPQGRTASYMLPGLIAVLLAECYVELGLLSLASEREGGNLERLLMTPMNYTGLILGKLAPWFLLGLINGILYLFVTHFGLGVPIRGDVVLLIAAMALYLVTCVAVGSYIATGSKGPGDAQVWLVYFFFPTMWLSGYIFPLSSVPKPFLVLSYALPQTHFIEIMRGICLRGASASELAPHLLYLVVMPVLLTVASVRRFTKAAMQ